MRTQTTRKAQTSKTDLSGPALKLLQFEADIRQCKNKEELIFHLANQLKRLVPFEQAIVFYRKGLRNYQIVASSDVSQVESSSPYLEEVKRWADRNNPPETGCNYEFRDIVTRTTGIPYNYAYWLPIKSDDLGAEYTVLLFLTTELNAQQKSLLERLSINYDHAFRAISFKRKPLPYRVRRNFYIKLVCFIFLIAICLVPLPISVMAPAEVIAKTPYILTAPFSGVIKRIEVQPNSLVNKGQKLVVFEDIQFRNEYLLYQQKLAVAKANFDKIQGAAFDHLESAHELTAAKAEHSLAQIEFQYAREQLQRSVIISPNSGVAIYRDKADLEGKAVQVGERILQIAQPKQIQYKIELPVRQLIAMKEHADVTIYLASAPLGGHKAKLVNISYEPTISSESIASYTLLAIPIEGQLPNIGARGTARIYGESYPLIWHFLRRPINMFRQWIGV